MRRSHKNGAVAVEPLERLPLLLERLPLLLKRLVGSTVAISLAGLRFRRLVGTAMLQVETMVHKLEVETMVHI